MSRLPPRRFLVNFVDGTAELNSDATPPAQEYLSLMEHDGIVEDLFAQLAASQNYAIELGAFTAKYIGPLMPGCLLENNKAPTQEGKDE